MIQTKTKILIKDNSPLLEANCINYSNNSSSKKGAKIGSCIKISVSKIKSTLNKDRSASAPALRETSIGRPLHSVLVIQTKALAHRGDGSTLQFNCNSGVSIILKKAGTKKSQQLGFKRVNSTIPFELKNKAHMQKVKIASSVVKLAKHLL